MTTERTPLPSAIDLSKALPTPHQPRHRFQSLTEVLALPPSEWLIKGLIGRDSFGVIYGPPGAGKTFVALALALSMGHGLGCFNRRTRRGGVALVVGEGTAGLRNRVRAWHDHHGLDPAEGAGVQVLPQPVNLLDAQVVAALIRDLLAVFVDNPPLVVFIDTLARCFGDGDENRQPDMARFVEACDLIRRALGCTVIILHHTPKEADQLRGSGALEGACDFVLRVGKADDGYQMFVRKQKDGPSGISLGFRMEGREVGVDEDGDPITSLVAVLDGAECLAPVPANDTEPKGRNQQAVLAILAGHADGLTDTEWRDVAKEAGAVGGANPNRAFREARDALVKAGLVLEEGERFLAA